MDILIIKDGFWTLIIIDSTRTNMVQETLTITTHVTMMAAKKKTQSYVE
jgi:hypothetical protein